jgi:hypothetical protein
VAQRRRLLRQSGGATEHLNGQNVGKKGLVPFGPYPTFPRRPYAGSLVSEHPTALGSSVNKGSPSPIL